MKKQRKSLHKIYLDFLYRKIEYHSPIYYQQAKLYEGKLVDGIIYIKNDTA